MENGVLLNPVVDSFLEMTRSKIYVDKTMLLDYTNSVLETKQKYICVSRPRRFGKTTTASMICAYYIRSNNTVDLFSKYKISETENFRKNINKYDVISINIQDLLFESEDSNDLINKIKNGILFEITQTYNDVSLYDSNNLSRTMQDISIQKGVKFVIIIDEWDCLFRESEFDRDAQKRYLDFLRDWLKDKTYIALAYMTGILPIKKYGTHSALNMFDEFSMEMPGVLSEYVGFTASEVEGLCREYGIDYEKCLDWYNGYTFPKCKMVFNPKSIVSLMINGEFSDYWIQTETYEALKIYIDLNYDGLRDNIISMMAKNRVRINTGSFSNDMTSFSNADDVMTLLIHLGYLAYDLYTKEVYIPNNEIMQEFITTTTVEKWDEVIRTVLRSEELLHHTWNKESKYIASYIQEAHFETSHIQYNDENALSYVVSLAYYAARQYYSVVRELPSGKGFADLAFIPKKSVIDKPAFIVELKWNKSAETAIRQIKSKKYNGVLSDFAGKVLLIGINYDKKTKIHECIIEEAEST